MQMEGWKLELFYQIMINVNAILKYVVKKHKMQLKPTLNVDIEKFKKIDRKSTRLNSSHE